MRASTTVIANHDDANDDDAQWYDVPELEFVPAGVVYEFPCEFVPEYEIAFDMIPLAWREVS